MKTKPSPCPICGGEPEVDYGLSGAPFPVPFVTCPTIHIKGDITSRCPMHADGIEAWNYICEVADRRAHARVAEAYQNIRQTIGAAISTYGDMAEARTGDARDHALTAMDAVKALDERIRSRTPSRVSVEEALAWGGAGAIATERQRQMDVEGWTPEHDDMHKDNQLAEAAACYALGVDQDMREDRHGVIVPINWPWDAKWWKPSNPDRRKNLVRAGALIAAEIDRLNRAALRSLAGGE